MRTAVRRERLLNRLHRGATTVPALAEELAVSERTLYRDLSALREAGHRVQATPGPGGGVRIAPDSRPRPVHFEVSEIVGLALSVAILQAMPHMPFADSAVAALDRARRALSADRQRALQRLLGRVLIGRPASERTRETLGSVDDGLLNVFERCFTASYRMRFAYVDRKGASSRRCIECVALVYNEPAWYIVAWDLDKDAPRIFRMDRMAKPVCGEALVGRHALREVVAIACPTATSAYPDWLGEALA